MLANMVRRGARRLWGSITSTITTTTTTEGTESQNGKRLIKLANEVLVCQIASAALNAKFYYSTDMGTTWTNYSSTDIAGWVCGSMASYVDSGGIERLVVVWKQSGTGGSRTDLIVYMMVGAFNAARTTLTWGTPIDIGGGFTWFSNPDVVAIADGTGGQAMVIYSSFFISTCTTLAVQCSINSSGVPTAGSSNTIGTTGSGSSNGHCWPSICLNVLDNRVHAAWVFDVTGATKATQYRTASFASSTWTWAGSAAIDLDSARFGTNQDQQQVICKYDYVLGRILVATHNRGSSSSDIRFIIYASTNFTSFTNVLDTGTLAAADRFYGMGFVVHHLTGDVYVFFSLKPSTTVNDVFYQKSTRSGSTLSALATKVTVEAFTGVASNQPNVCALHKDGRTFWMYTKITGSTPYSIKHGGDEL